MGKKKLKKAIRKAIKKSNRLGTANLNDSSSLFAAGGNQDDFGFGVKGPGQGLGWLNSLGLPKGFGGRRTEQFILGALLGGAAAYVLCDEQLRAKIMKSFMKLYAGMTGGLEEFKEQMADLKAEMSAEHGIAK